MKLMCLQKKNLLLAIVLLLEILLLFAMYNVHIDDAYIYSFVGVSAIISMLTTCSVIYIISKRIDFFFLFILLSYLFSFGQSMLISMGIELPQSPFSIIYSGFNTDEIKDAALFVLVSICTVGIGYLTITQNEVLSNEKQYIVGKDKACAVGWGLILFSLGPSFYLLIKDIKFTFTTGYASTLVAYTGIDRIISLISGFFISGIFLVFLFETATWKRNVFYILLAMYLILQMVGGSRLPVFRIGIALFLVYKHYLKKLDTRKTILLLGVFVLMCFFFSLISYVRIHVNSINDLASYFRESITSVWKNNILISSIREMGNTQIINTLVYTKCPSSVDYQYGFSFVKIIWAILPNFMGNKYTGYIGVDIVFSELYTKTNAGLGASFISEGYWNFGWFALIYFFIFGILLGFLERKFGQICHSENVSAISLFLIVYIMYFMIFMVRSELLSLGRSFVYYALVPALLCKIRIKV